MGSGRSTGEENPPACDCGTLPAATAAAAAARLMPWCLNCSFTNCSILKWCSGLENSGAGGTGPWFNGGSGSLNNPPTLKGLCMSGGGSRWCLILGGGCGNPVLEQPEDVLLELLELWLLLLLPLLLGEVST